MSYPIMASLPWALPGFKKSPQFNTVVQRPAAGRGLRTMALMAYPTWNFELDLNFAIGDETLANTAINNLLGLYTATYGGAGFFLFSDPNDHTCTDVQFGTGDGATTVFQLQRQIGGGGFDVIQNVHVLTNIKINGTPTGAYSIDSTGVVTFSSPPAGAATLTWTGTFYYLCRFQDDTLGDLARDAFYVSGGNTTGLWSVSSVKFESVLI
jgi:uncharacterized protein (TIGR02217 family)